MQLSSYHGNNPQILDILSLHKDLKDLENSFVKNTDTLTQLDQDIATKFKENVCFKLLNEYKSQPNEFQIKIDRLIQEHAQDVFRDYTQFIQVQEQMDQYVTEGKKLLQKIFPLRDRIQRQSIELYATDKNIDNLRELAKLICEGEENQNSFILKIVMSNFRIE